MSAELMNKASKHHSLTLFKVYQWYVTFNSKKTFWKKIFKNNIKRYNVKSYLNKYIYFNKFILFFKYIYGTIYYKKCM